ncbi:squalene/phytoene synthase family protein [Rhodopila sp.]|uniref:squalene/phytoene synthase family protein n=1 Tax=Rhodopila sp. TaxID=2480087 RepID=UPI003D0A2104
MNDAIAALVRRHDPDRFLTALFAPPARRDALLILYAFNHELARAREVVSEPPLALIRLQWWREVVEGTPRRHEVAAPLSEAIAAGQLDPALLLPVIEARESEAYGDFQTVKEWRTWLLAGAGGLAVAAARALDAPAPAVLQPFGAAYGVAGLLRASSVLTARQRCLLPRDVLERHGLTPEAFMQDPVSAPARAVSQAVAEEGEAFLAEARAVPLPRAAIAAALPALLARRDLARWPKIAWPRQFGDRLAVTAAGLTGRLSL